MTCEIRILTNHGVQRALLLLTTVTVFVFFCGFGGRPKHCLLKNRSRSSAVFPPAVSLYCVKNLHANSCRTDKHKQGFGFEKSNKNEDSHFLHLLMSSASSFCNVDFMFIKRSLAYGPQRCKLFVVSSLLLQL